MINMTSGTMDDFFCSALKTATEVDKGLQVTSKHTIWMEQDDFKAHINKCVFTDRFVGMLSVEYKTDDEHYNDIMK